MKKIINGKKYDTDTAKCVGHDSFGCRGDFRYWFEQLYQKQTGEFFIYGDGAYVIKPCLRHCGSVYLAVKHFKSHDISPNLVRF